MKENQMISKGAKKRKQACESKIKEQCNKLLYKGAKVSKLRVLLGLLSLQTIYGWSDVSVIALFKLLHKIVLEGNYMLDSCTKAKKTSANLGIDYEGIHASPNHHYCSRKS